MARSIAKSWEGRTFRRLRKNVDMLFAYLKRILKLDRSDYEALLVHAISSFSQPPKPA